MKNFRTSNFAVGNTEVIALSNGGTTSRAEEDEVRAGFAIKRRFRSIETGTRREGNGRVCLGAVDLSALEADLILD